MPDGIAATGREQAVPMSINRNTQSKAGSVFSGGHASAGQGPSTMRAFSKSVDITSTLSSPGGIPLLPGDLQQNG